MVLFLSLRMHFDSIAISTRFHLLPFVTTTFHSIEWIVWFNVKADTFRFYCLCTTNFVCVCMQMCVHRIWSPNIELEICGKKIKKKTRKEEGERKQQPKKRIENEISVKVQCALVNDSRKKDREKNGYMHRLSHSTHTLIIATICVSKCTISKNSTVTIFLPVWNLFCFVLFFLSFCVIHL